MGRQALRVWLFLIVASLAVAGKEKPLVAIVLYDGTGGRAYVEINDFLINGTRSLSICQPQPLDNSRYKQLEKTALAAGQILVREGDELKLTFPGGGPTRCVLPTGLKLQGNRTYAHKELLQMAPIGVGVAARSSNAGEPPTTIQPGMKIYVLDSAEAELPEYLRAKDAGTLEFWGEFLTRYPGSQHAPEAHRSRAELITRKGQNDLEAYQQSVGSGAPNYDRLKSARINAEQALREVERYGDADELRIAVEKELERLLEVGRADVKAYQKALAEHTAGYQNLGKAKAQVEIVVKVAPAYQNADQLKKDIANEESPLLGSIAQAEGLLKNSQPDDAYRQIERYKSFASELPSIVTIVDAGVNFRRNRAEQAEKDGNWPNAIKEYKRALDMRPDPQIQQALKHAQEQDQLNNDKQAAQVAIDNAKIREAQKQFIDAWNELNAVPESQRALADAERERIKNDYVQDLTSHGNKLFRMHRPIRGPVNIQGAREAYDLLSRALKLVEDQDTKLDVDMLRDDINDYYVKLAKRMLEKPRDSGVGLGYLLLKEAEQFKADSQDTHNQITKYFPEFEKHARLSVGVQFNDQTARAGGVAFSDPLANAVVMRLESAGIPGLKPQQRSASDEAEGVSGPATNFAIVGSITQHKVDKTVDTVSRESHFTSATRDVKNPAWVEAKRQVDAAQAEFDRAKSDYDQALARVGFKAEKKEVQPAKAKLDETQKKLADANKTLAGLSETISEPVTLPYNYQENTVHLNAVVEILYRLQDTSSQTAPPAFEKVHVDKPKTLVILQDVKPEDSDGKKAQGTMPDDAQLQALLAEAEEEARTALVNNLIQQLKGLPPKILEQARLLQQSSDTEGAAEKYLLYLNSTAEKETPERNEALDFLKKNFVVSSATVQLLSRPLL